VTFDSDFKVTTFLKSNSSKTVRFRDKVTIEHYPNLSNGSTFNDLAVTCDLDFKVTILFDIEYIRNDTRESHSYYRTSVGSRMRSIEW